ncbi:MAG: NAD+ synthase [Gammaproteobacteria bacterium]|nr:NAD+ synthase [Gammaproteobacteria bacterium]MCW8972887.1 NAD+ synthase [Gammaproteobacteria bacterium]MCW8993486.1 NAD+ synthase [Gammaproteobacteria bacterium]
MKKLRIVMAQLNMLVGDIEGNAAKVIAAAERARDDFSADAIVFPELTLTGYPPEDLLLRPGLYTRVLAALEQINLKVRDIDIILGHPHAAAGGLYNAASLLRADTAEATYHKQHLPNYSVFDEKRYFAVGSEPCVVEIKGVPVGLTVCEDIWQPGSVAQAVDAGARLIVNINASPFHIDKGRERERAVRERVTEGRVPVLYVNLVGGQDELVFDGGSFVMDREGNITQQSPAFEEGLYPVEFAVAGGEVTPQPGLCAAPLSEEASVYNALVLGVRDYVEKNGFPGVVIGLSGGIDSALTIAIAVDAIGAERVEAVMMPSRYTADISLAGAREEAVTLGVDYRVIPIEPAFKVFLDSLKEEFAGREPDTTEENIQARCRGIILMAISNKKGKMVLTTGNKSEMAVGYATLYGDMVGGFGALKDVPKTLVFRLARYRNTISPVIPEAVINRPPSAELAADQKDSDSLPDYPELDAILQRYVEQDQCADDIIAAGFDEAVVRRVIRLVDLNEYKRRQAPPGVRITRRAFGRDRRYPITSGFNRR